MPTICEPSLALTCDFKDFPFVIGYSAHYSIEHFSQKS